MNGVRGALDSVVTLIRRADQGSDAVREGKLEMPLTMSSQVCLGARPFPAARRMTNGGPDRIG